MMVAGGFPMDTTTTEFVPDEDLPTLDPSTIEYIPARNVFQVDAEIMAVSMQRIRSMR